MTSTLVVASEIGGRIAAVEVQEGDHVTADQELVRLDHALLDAQVAQARAAVDTARAQLEALSAGPRPAELSAAQCADQGPEGEHGVRHQGPAAEPGPGIEAGNAGRRRREVIVSAAGDGKRFAG